MYAVRIMGETTLGNLVRAAREERGLTVRQLAEMVGVEHPTITRIETGHTSMPRPEVIDGIVRVLGLSGRAVLSAMGYSKRMIEGVNDTIYPEPTPARSLIEESELWPELVRRYGSEQAARAALARTLAKSFNGE